MMTLADAAGYFDRTPLRHPDNGTVLAYGQIEPFDDSKRDGYAAYRRILSLRPGISVPSVIDVMGQRWLVGTKESDGLEGPLRDKFVMHPAREAFNISRPGAFLAAGVSSTSWGAAEWSKDGRELESSSEVVPLYDILLPADADVREHDVVWAGGRAFLVQQPHPSPSGFFIAPGLLLEAAAPVTARIAGRVYNPAAGEYVVSYEYDVPCLPIRWQSLYRYGSEAAARFREGDVSIVVPGTAVVDTLAVITVQDRAYRPVSTEAQSDAIIAHVRPA